MQRSLTCAYTYVGFAALLVFLGSSALAQGLFVQSVTGHDDYVVRIEQDSRQKRPSYCTANLGSFTDGVEELKVSIRSRYDIWAISIVSERNLEPPMITPDIFSGKSLPMNSSSRLREDGLWETHFVNSNIQIMRNLASPTSINLSVARGDSAIRIEVPRLPEVLHGMEQCLQEEEVQHRTSYCAGQDSWSLANIPSIREYCAGYY